jgi:SAM-dependent methyltransferase
LKPESLKSFIYIYYFLRSVTLRGLLNTLRLFRAELREEKRFGIRTSAFRESNSKEFFHYQGASYLVLSRIFSEIKETRGFEFVDIGCGMGRVIFVAESEGYNRLLGIELREELLAEARQNENRYRLRRAGSEIRFVQANAIGYAYEDRPAVYFLFNPFNGQVLEEVLSAICRSTRSETWFVYMNPLFPEPFDRPGVERVRTVKTRFYKEAFIYVMNRKDRGAEAQRSS